MSKFAGFLAAFIMCLVFTGNQANAAVPIPPEIAAVAAQSAPGATNAISVAKSVLEVPKNAAEILLLPMGLIEAVLFPLPGLQFTHGMKNVGTGLLAPFKLTSSVLSLPYNVVNSLATGK